MKKFNFKTLLLAIGLVVASAQPAWAGPTIKGGTFYYDNSKTNWSRVSIFVGKDKYTSVYDDVNAITNTKLYYRNMSSWDGATYIGFVSCSGWNSGEWGKSNLKNCGDGYTGAYEGGYTFNANDLYLFTCSSNGGTLNVEYQSAYSNLNKTQTIKAKVSTDGGSNYSDVTTSPGTLSASSKKFSDYKTCGTTTSLSSGKITCGYTATTTLTAADATGYTFVAWYKGSTQVSTDKSITIYPTDEATYYAYYKENRYSISATANPSAGGTVTPSSATAMGQITGGDITATNNTGYHFTGWEVGTATGTFGSASTANTTFKPTKVGTVVANFAENTHNITISNDDNGSTTPSGAQSNVGEVTGISITATPNTNFAFKEWVYTGGTISAQSATTTFKPTADNATIQATFQSTAVYYTWGFGVYQSTGGTVESTVAAGNHVQGGTSITLTASPATGYEVEGWYDNADCTGDKLQTGGDTYTFSISSNSVRYVKFKEKTFSVTVQAGTGIDQVTGGGANVGQLTGTAISATVKNGYTWSTWTGGTGTFASGATVKDNTFYPTAASTLTATATENKYNVTINTNLPAGASLKFGSTAKDWGSVANVGIDSKQDITVTLNAGYKYDGSFSVTGGARVSGSGSSFTIWADGADGTVTVNIVEDLSSNWYLVGTDNIFPAGWNLNENSMLRKKSGYSTAKIGYLTVHVTDIDLNDDTKYQFKVVKKKTGSEQSDTWYGYSHDWEGGQWLVLNKDNTSGTLYTGDENGRNVKFVPNIAGDYEFKVDFSGTYPIVTVTWPVYNCVYGEFDSWNKDAHKLNFGDGNEASTVVNITDISKSYQFLVLVNSNYFTNSASSTTPITRSTASEVTFAAKGGSDNNAKFTPDIAGDYTFTYNKSTSKLTITYPALPTASTTATEARIFNENPLSFIESGDGTEDNPYKIYTDEALTIDITALAAQTNLTAKYQFGEEAATTDVLTKTITNPSTTKTSIVVKAFYESDGVAGTAWEKTIYYQGVDKPSLNLTTSWSTHNDEAQEGVNVPENVTVHYSAGNYSGLATVTRSKDGGDPVNFFTVESGDQKSETYALPDKNVQRQTFVATAEVNGRTFSATKAISIYRLVEITITDAHNLMTNYYMWEDGTNPTRKEAEWPGNSFFSTLGNAHIFYVKYPSYTHFVLNNGNAATEEDAIQTVNVTLPDQSACYTIGEKITTEGDNKNKYDVQVAAQCPNKLYVGNIAPVSAVQGEGVIVSPQVDIDPLLNADDLRITFDYKSATGITCDQRGRSFMVTATAGTGTYEIQVTYSIPGADPVTKDVTINVTSAIMIQAKYGNLGWSDHNEIYIHYWGTGVNATQKMSWKDYVGEDSNKQDRVYARIPLGTDNKINFQIYAWNMDDDKQWHITKDVTNVTASGCYTITPGEENQKRNISRDDNNCWTAYYVEIDMNNGTVYRSNTVEDLTQTVSFFAPGASEENAKAGLVRIICNGSQTATIAAATFDSSTIYTAKIAESGTELTDVKYYTGDYYIRTDGVEGGWSDYKKASHKFTNFSLYPGAKYDYYWVANVKKVNDKQTFNIKACIGNEYNENLANMIESDNYTDGTGNITVDDEYGVNLRFGYNPQTNHFERAILRGAGNNYFLNIQGDNIYNDEDCNDQVLNETNYNSHPEYSKFNDVSDWVYEKLIFVQIDNEHQSSSVLLKSKAFNGQILYQLGYTTDNFGRSTSTPAQKVVMGAGSTNGKYTLRVIYDYKTNRLSASWEPSGEINEVKKVDADILFVSHEGENVKQITFGADSATARLTSLQSVMYVLELENNEMDKKTTPDAQYWIALPFECKISDIFGIENYITLNENRIALQGYWGIMRYRGDLRAQKGWFEEDTPDGFWEWMYPTETLVPGEGYVLYVEKKSLNWNSITVEEPCEGTEDGCQDGKRSVSKYVKRFYFPSLVEGFTMNKTSEATSKITYPDQPCNITSPVNRRAEDSNWKVIAPKSYNNVTINSADPQGSEYVLEGPGFIYVYNEHEVKGRRYTATASEGFEFQAFHGYMAQYGGTITWNPYSKTEHPTSAPRFAEEPSFKGGMLTVELVQNNEQLDRTFVNLSKNGTTGFDQNLDLTKISESCAQIASISENVLYAGSTLPLDIELVPLNVKVTANGIYDIALEKSLEGLEVKLLDVFEQTTTLLDLMPATVTLEKGEYKDRFFLQLTQKAPQTPTSLNGSLEQYNLPMDKTQKLLINGNIYLINAGRVYNATGAELR